ncbi:uncharacterized protein [Ptychodera flava]|uniref:uncharacterized protein n=1 Tax=Ptychodera flava TaxID=63121 RepID=UPI003969F288
MASLLSIGASLFIKQKPFSLKPKSGIPAPLIPHVTLGEDIVAHKRLTIIGDVHGCYDELIELLDKTRSLDDDALVLFVGDLINKGPKNKQVLDYVKELPNAYAVRGNHDEAVLREMMFQRKNDYVLSKKYGWTAELDQSDWDYLSQLPYTISIPSKRILLVHAGLVPGKPLWRQNAPDMVTMRNLEFTDYFGGNGWQGNSNSGKGQAWASLWRGRAMCISVMMQRENCNGMNLPQDWTRVVCMEAVSPLQSWMWMVQ